MTVNGRRRLTRFQVEPASKPAQAVRPRGTENWQGSLVRGWSTLGAGLVKVGRPLTRWVLGKLEVAVISLAIKVRRVAPMTISNPLGDHRRRTRQLAMSLRPSDVYHWLVQYGYFPESYVLPPCFSVVEHPARQVVHYHIKKKGKSYDVPVQECVTVHFPKSELTRSPLDLTDQSEVEG